jgi:hypothetical protein
VWANDVHGGVHWIAGAKIERAGHFLQEDAPERSGRLLAESPIIESAN